LCHAREFNKALTKADENCHLLVGNQGRFCLIVQYILPGKALLIRYGFQNWMHTKWALPFLEAMFVKYTAVVNREGREAKDGDEDADENTINIEQVAIW
jgi:hypothetical protein